ncbi:VOC family protein [Vibrio sp.]|nr:VOC family protein [Vibrio sp.]
MTNQLENIDDIPAFLISQLPVFNQRVRELADCLEMNIDRMDIDHIALRINDINTAKRAHEQWLHYGKELSCAEVNGRPIVIIELDKPLILGGSTTQCIELPYPAEGKLYPVEGWEHIEVVLPHDNQWDNYITQVEQSLPSESYRKERKIKQKNSSPSSKGERIPNPTVALKRDNICIKVHPHPLKTIIESER